MYNEFDLQESLAYSIIHGTGLGNLKISYLSDDVLLGLVPEQGSHMISKDYSGQEYWIYNYAIYSRTKNGVQDVEQIKDNLFNIANFLSGVSANDLRSANGSFLFDKLKVSSAPSEIKEDIEDEVTYMLDVAVFVYTKLS